MTPFKRILVPIDFSEHSSAAVRAATDLARRFEAELVLAHVYEPIAYALPEGYVLFTPTQLANLLTELQRLLANAKKDAEAAGVPRVETKQLQGAVAPEIINFAREGKFDLIVMGTHGRTGLKHAFLGSVAEKVLRQAPCPVLTLRATEP
jgi:universal stress protein A